MDGEEEKKDLLSLWEREIRGEDQFTTVPWNAGDGVFDPYSGSEREKSPYRPVKSRNELETIPQEERVDGMLGYVADERALYVLQESGMWEPLLETSGEMSVGEGAFRKSGNQFVYTDENGNERYLAPGQLSKLIESADFLEQLKQKTQVLGDNDYVRAGEIVQPNCSQPGDEQAFGVVLVRHDGGCTIEWLEDQNFVYCGSHYMPDIQLKRASLSHFIDVVRKNHDLFPSEFFKEGWSWQWQQYVREDIKRELQWREETVRLREENDFLKEEVSGNKKTVERLEEENKKTAQRMEDRLGSVLEKLKMLEESGADQKEIEEVEKKEALPVLANMGKRQLVWHVMKQGSKMVGGEILKRLLKVAIQQGLDISGVFKFLGLG